MHLSQAVNLLTKVSGLRKGSHKKLESGQFWFFFSSPLGCCMPFRHQRNIDIVLSHSVSVVCDQLLKSLSVITLSLPTVRVSVFAAAFLLPVVTLVYICLFIKW